jgi:WD40 repeat protein
VRPEEALSVPPFGRGQRARLVKGASAMRRVVFLSSKRWQAMRRVVRGGALSADGRRVVSGSSDRTVKVWDALKPPAQSR